MASFKLNGTTVNHILAQNKTQRRAQEKALTKIYILHHVKQNNWYT